jgi:hypothetical protein
VPAEPLPALSKSNQQPRKNLRRTLRRALVGSCAFALASCVAGVAPRSSDHPPSLERLHRRADLHNRGSVVIVALDGVRWQEVFEGVDPALARAHRLAQREVVSASELMPNLHHVIATRGSAIGAPGHGQQIAASGPNYVSLPGYIEMLSGRPSACQDNDCPRVEQPTIADELSEWTGGWAGDVAVIASWPGIAKAAARHPDRILLSAGRTRGATRHFLRYDRTAGDLLDAGARSAAYPGHGDFRPDHMTAAIALRYLRKQRPMFLFVGLGEPDAFAHRGLYRDYLASIRQADAVIGEIDHLLAERAAAGSPTTLIVTTDHGRGARFASHGGIAPESARIWLVAAGAGIAARGYAAAPTERRLADLAPTVRRLVGLPPDTAPGAGSVLEELMGSGPSPFWPLARAR